MKSTRRFGLRGQSPVLAVETPAKTTTLIDPLNAQGLLEIANALGRDNPIVVEAARALTELLRNDIDRGMLALAAEDNLEAEAERALDREAAEAPVYGAAEERPRPRSQRILGTPESRQSGIEYQEFHSYGDRVSRRILVRTSLRPNSDNVHLRYIGGPCHGQRVSQSTQRHDHIRVEARDVDTAEMRGVFDPGTRNSVSFTTTDIIYNRRDYCLEGEFIVIYAVDGLSELDIQEHVEDMARR